MITKEFILAGSAIFTLQVPDSYRNSHVFCNPHYTFKVVKKDKSAEYDEAWFVNLLTGPNNLSDYTYLGMLLPFTGDIRLTKASKYKDDTIVIKLLRRTLARVWANEQNLITSAGFNLHHEGRCGRCAKTLTVPESVESGFGPECIGKVFSSRS